MRDQIALLVTGAEPTTPIKCPALLVGTALGPEYDSGRRLRHVREFVGVKGSDADFFCFFLHKRELLLVNCKKGKCRAKTGGGVSE